VTSESTFARKPSGFVRRPSPFDAFGVGLMIARPMTLIWHSIYIGCVFLAAGNMARDRHQRPVMSGATLYSSSAFAGARSTANAPAGCA
jgi:hypothetical protein